MLIQCFENLPLRVVNLKTLLNNSELVEKPPIRWCFFYMMSIRERQVCKHALEELMNIFVWNRAVSLWDRVGLFLFFFFLPSSLNSLPSSSPTPPLCPTEHILHFQGMETCLNHTDSQIKFNIFLQDIHDMQIPEGLFLIHMKVPYAREIRALSY